MVEDSQEWDDLWERTYAKVADSVEHHFDVYLKDHPARFTIQSEAISDLHDIVLDALREVIND